MVDGLISIEVGGRVSPDQSVLPASETVVTPEPAPAPDTAPAPAPVPDVSAQLEADKAALIEAMKGGRSQRADAPTSAQDARPAGERVSAAATKVSEDTGIPVENMVTHASTDEFDKALTSDTRKAVREYRAEGGRTPAAYENGRVHLNAVSLVEVADQEGVSVEDAEL